MAGGRAAAIMEITDRDVRGLAAKLKGLHALLSAGEQALLDALLRRAAHDEAAVHIKAVPDAVEVAWAVSFNPFPYLDAIAADPARGEKSLQSAPKGGDSS